MPRKFCIILRVVPPSLSAYFSAGLGTNPVSSASSPPLFSTELYIRLLKGEAPFPFPGPRALPDPRPSAHTARQIYTATAPARMFLLPPADPTDLQDPFQAYTPMNA